MINHSDEAGTVAVEGLDDSGTVHGPSMLSVPARGAAHFNSGDLERGNTAKGLSAGVGDGDGDWRLRFSSELDVDILGYIRTKDGFVTSMHDVAETSGTLLDVPIFNPASNASQRSKVRLVNSAGESNVVTIGGVDDAGNQGASDVVVTLRPRAARTLWARDLEEGTTTQRARSGTERGSGSFGCRPSDRCR